MYLISKIFTILISVLCLDDVLCKRHYLPFSGMFMQLLGVISLYSS